MNDATRAGHRDAECYGALFAEISGEHFPANPAPMEPAEALEAAGHVISLFAYAVMERHHGPGCAVRIADDAAQLDEG